MKIIGGFRLCQNCYLYQRRRRLKVSETTIRRLITANKLKSFRIGDLIRIREVDLVDFIEQQLHVGEIA